MSREHLHGPTLFRYQVPSSIGAKGPPLWRPARLPRIVCRQKDKWWPCKDSLHLLRLHLQWVQTTKWSTPVICHLLQILAPEGAWSLFRVPKRKNCDCDIIYDGKIRWAQMLFLARALGCHFFPVCGESHCKWSSLEGINNIFFFLSSRLFVGQISNNQNGRIESSRARKSVATKVKST